MEKRMFICTLLLLALIVNGISFRKVSGKVINGYDDLIGIAGKEYNTETNIEDPKYNIVEMFAVQNSITLENNLCSKFVDIIGRLEEGNYVNVSKFADWETLNDKVATANMGRIKGNGAGQTNIIATYNGLNVAIEIVVQNNIDLLAYESSILQKFNQSVYATVADDSQAVLDRAVTMKNVTWIPTKNLTGYKNYWTYSANTSYTGIPYSQSEYQCDKDAFLQKFNDTDSGFYSNYTRFGYVMPKYGIDCSAYLSFSWGISRYTSSGFIDGIKDGSFNKVGSYSAASPSNADLLSSYALMQPVDGLVKDGHARLVVSNYPSMQTVLVYEQNGPTPEMSQYTYTDLEADTYLPFRR